MRSVDAPVRADAMAAGDPAEPDPTTTTSYRPYLGKVVKLVAA